MNMQGKERILEKRLRGILETPGAELSGLAAAAIVEGELAFDAYFGRRFIDPDHPDRDLPVDRNTRFRIASVSKPFAALGVMTLVERGLLDLERDVSDYLGFELRNPHFPDKAISVSMLLSHTSSLRDGKNYLLPLGHELCEFFSPGTDYWEEGAHFAGADGEVDRSPGAYFEYCNLAFGVVGTIIERISRQRFDLFMREAVLSPLGLEASFNVNLLSDEGFENLATIYRKGSSEEDWNPDGPWVAQIDDYRGRRPDLPCRLGPGLGPEALEAYVPGTNGTLFSPQGGLRVSALELVRLARFFLGAGELEGRRLLSPDSIEEMRRLRWRWDPLHRNGTLYNGLMRESGLGLMHTTASQDEAGGDRLLPGGGPRMWGHHGDAYGLLSGMLFEPEGRFGIVYIIGGTGRNPRDHRGIFSSASRWEEEIQRALLEELVRP